MIEIGATELTLAELRAVAIDGEECRVPSSAHDRMVLSRRVVEKVAAGEDPVYGINTGFGDLSHVRIPPDKIRDLQLNLLRSHAAGVGKPLGREEVRGMLLLRAHALALGYSGIRPIVVENLIALLNKDVSPRVPRRGSVGASGDLAPLAHLALVLVGEGVATVNGRDLPGAEALEIAGIEPVRLEPKEGLALINGTQAMTSLTAIGLLKARQLVDIADLVGALSAEALRATDSAFDRRLHELRPHPGQKRCAANLWALLQGSQIRESHREDDPRVQDPYSVRCMPQVHGAVRDTLTWTTRGIETEMNSVTDNPLVFPDSDEVISGGNFHGEPVALAADFLSIGLSELGAISERRIEKLTNRHFSGLPDFLVEDPGLNSGFMMAQVTAAALASENKMLSHPASTDSIPTSADKEDHVSMGMGAALKMRRVEDNVRTILAIELLAAAQGIDLLRPLRSSSRLETLHEAIRQYVPKWETDREMAPDIGKGIEFLNDDISAHLQELS